MENVGAQIRKARQARGWTIQALADKAGLSKTGLIGIELSRKDTKVETVTRLAAALGMPVADLFADETVAK